MELKVWTPFFDLDKDLRSMFDRFPRFFGETVPFEFRPTIDMVREDGTLVVTTELPGIDPEKDIHITIEDDVLVIKGEKASEKEVTEKDRYLHERRFGSFERRLPLPDGVDAETISASYDKGILTVRVPVPTEQVETTRHIPITTG